ncbi:MAG: curli production assembly protein CsgG [Ignavibacteria bacterium]|jgi:curli biogenesis system outer membrane secretion channel CsgG|nr:curli production assembly protein CsgG [Ignavibacteria bacterium]MCU7502084.1 curli production assembly protein CsgG [Ignavibacteria bacterium]MCU7515486.1 curli production assembly protein CsgG [Ignavibacteria bacterium]
MKRKYPYLLIVPFIFQACATVKTPEVRIIPETKPQISATLTQPEKTLKRKVAIARFTNETKYGQGFFYDKNDDPLGKQAMDILSAKLAATGKFLLLERSDLNQVIKEKGMGKISEENIAADYLILGSVSEFGRKTTSDVGVFSRTKTQTAYAKVNIRLVDVHTSQIIYSEEGEGEATAESGTVLGVGERADYDATLNDKVISAAISKLVNNIIENLLDKPWRSYILSLEDNNIIISGGKSQGIKEGDTFNVFRRGKKVNNPQTNTVIELPGKQIASIKVISTFGNTEPEEISYCEKISGDIPAQDFSDLYIEENKPMGAHK